MTTLNTCFEQLWQELQHQLKADKTISPIVLWQTDFQNKIQLVIHDWDLCIWTYAEVNHIVWKICGVKTRDKKIKHQARRRIYCLGSLNCKVILLPPLTHPWQQDDCTNVKTHKLIICSNSSQDKGKKDPPPCQIPTCTSSHIRISLPCQPGKLTNTTLMITVVVVKDFEQFWKTRSAPIISDFFSIALLLSMFLTTTENTNSTTDSLSKTLYVNKITIKCLCF